MTAGNYGVEAGGVQVGAGHEEEGKGTFNLGGNLICPVLDTPLQLPQLLQPAKLLLSVWDGRGSCHPLLNAATPVCPLADVPLLTCGCRRWLRCLLLQFAKLVSNEMLESVNKVQDAIQLALAKAEKVRGTCAQGCIRKWLTCLRYFRPKTLYAVAWLR